MAAAAYPHISADGNGTLRVGDTGHKVLVLLERHVAEGTTAEEFVASHEDLSLAQAHAMLAYYYDNKVEMDDVLRQREEEAERLMAELATPPALAKLQDLKRQRSNNAKR